MADKIMYIPNDDTQNYTSLTQLKEPTNQNSIKLPKVVNVNK